MGRVEPAIDVCRGQEAIVQSLRRCRGGCGVAAAAVAAAANAVAGASAGGSAATAVAAVAAAATSPTAAATAAAGATASTTPTSPPGGGSRNAKSSMQEPRYVMYRPPPVGDRPCTGDGLPPAAAYRDSP